MKGVTQVGAYGMRVVESSAEGGTEHGTASSDGTERPDGSDESGDGKAGIDMGVNVGSAQRCGKGRGGMGR